MERKKVRESNTKNDTVITDKNNNVYTVHLQAKNRLSAY